MKVLCSNTLYKEVRYFLLFTLFSTLESATSSRIGSITMHTKFLTLLLLPAASIAAVPCTALQSTLDSAVDEDEPIEARHAVPSIEAEQCPQKLTVKTSLAFGGLVETFRTTCSKLTGQFSDPNSNAAHYKQYVQQRTNCEDAGACLSNCKISISQPFGIESILGGLRAECKNAGGIYTQNV